MADDVRWKLVDEYCAVAYRRGDTRMHKDRPAAFISVADPEHLHPLMLATERVVNPEPTPPETTEDDDDGE